MNKKSPPVAVCTDCGKYWHDIRVANKRCNQKYGGKRCQGVFGSAIGTDDWQECEVCAGSGSVNGERCELCQGSGFECIRDEYR